MRLWQGVSSGGFDANALDFAQFWGESVEFRRGGVDDDGDDPAFFLGIGQPHASHDDVAVLGENLVYFHGTFFAIADDGRNNS